MILRKNAKVLIINYKIDTLNGIINKKRLQYNVCNRQQCMFNQCVLELSISYLSHLPRVKSGISTGAPPLFADVWVNSTRQLHNAAS